MKTSTANGVVFTLQHARDAARSCPTHGHEPKGWGKSHTYVVTRNRKTFSPPLFVYHMCLAAGAPDLRPLGDTNGWTFRVLRELGINFERIH